MIDWERLRTTVAEAAVLARSEAFDAFQKLGEHYGAVRRWSPVFLQGAYPGGDLRFPLRATPGHAGCMPAAA